MTLPLTRDALAAAYEYLRATPPFCGWNLPEPEDIKFVVARHPQLFGWCDRKRGKHVIAISRRTVGHTMTLMETMAHEMIHLHEANAGAMTNGQHSAAFRKWAEQVCKVHGFDAKRF